MPYFVVVYDVDQDRGNKVLKCIRRYLVHVQNSVLEGELTAGQFAELKAALEEVVEGEDSVLFYKMREEWVMDRLIVGRRPPSSDGANMI